MLGEGGEEGVNIRKYASCPSVFDARSFDIECFRVGSNGIYSVWSLRIDFKKC